MPRYSLFDSTFFLTKEKCVITYMQNPTNRAFIIECIHPKKGSYSISVISNYPPIVSQFSISQQIKKRDIIKHISQLNSQANKAINEGYLSSSWSISIAQKNKFLDILANRGDALNEKTWDIDLLRAIGITFIPYDINPRFFPIPQFLQNPKQLAVNLFISGMCAVLGATFSFSPLLIIGLAVGGFALGDILYQYCDKQGLKFSMGSVSQPNLSTSYEQEALVPIKVFTPRRHHMKTRSCHKIEDENVNIGKKPKAKF